MTSNQFDLFQDIQSWIKCRTTTLSNIKLISILPKHNSSQQDGCGWTILQSQGSEAIFFASIQKVITIPFTSFQENIVKLMTPN